MVLTVMFSMHISCLFQYTVYTFVQSPSNHPTHSTHGLPFISLMKRLFKHLRHVHWWKKTKNMLHWTSTMTSESFICWWRLCGMIEICSTKRRTLDWKHQRTRQRQKWTLKLDLHCTNKPGYIDEIGKILLWRSTFNPVYCFLHAFHNGDILWRTHRTRKEHNHWSQAAVMFRLYPNNNFMTTLKEISDYTGWLCHILIQTAPILKPEETVDANMGKKK